MSVTNRIMVTSQASHGVAGCIAAMPLAARLGMGIGRDSTPTTDRRRSCREESQLEEGEYRRKRILAMCLGGIGDTVLAFAALRDLRAASPHDHLTALAMWPQSAELLNDLGIFDEVLQHNYQKERTWRSLLATLRLRGHGYDASILTFPTNRFEYNLLARLIGAPRRYGHRYLRGGDAANLRFLLTDTVDQVRGRHTIDENRAIVACLTGITPSQSADPRLGPLDPQYHEAAERMMAHLNEPLLAIHPGCTIYKGHAARRWDAECFGDLCRRAHRELGLQPVIFGMPDEIELKLKIQSLCPEAFLAHGPTIRHTAAMLARCSCMVSNDSGLAHIASAVDVPVVMICGPTDPASIGPYANKGRVVTSGLGCSPCFQVGRKPLRCINPEYQACLKGIRVDDVLAAVAVCLPGHPAPHAGGLGLHACLSRRAKSLALPVLAGAN